MNVDIEELDRKKQKNFEERLEFIDRYVEWLKRTPNKKWSKQQKKIVG